MGLVGHVKSGFFSVSECSALWKMLYAYKMGHYSGISAVVRTQRAAVLEIANP